MGRILVYSIIFVVVGLTVMFLFSLLFQVVAVLFIAALVGAVVVAVVWTAIEIIGMFRSDEDESIMEKITLKGNPDKGIDEKVEEELQSMKQRTEPNPDDHGRRQGQHGGEQAQRNVQE